MSAPLLQNDFSLIWGDCPASSSEARPVRTSAARTPRAKASMGNGRASTSKPSASSESAALVGSLLRTALISELGALTASSPRWRNSATPAGRSWSVLTMSAPITSASGPGSSDATSAKLPTPMKSDGMTDGAGGGAGSTYPFRMIISTPRASDMKAGGHGDTGRMGTVRHLLATPRKTDPDRGFRGDVRAQLEGQNSRHAGMFGTPTSNPAPRGSVLRRMKDRETSIEDAWDRTPNAGEIVHFMLPTPTKTKYGGQSYPEDPSKKRPSLDALIRAETLPTPTKRDKRMDAWSPAYDKRKSPSMDAVMDGALTDRASDKWAYARQIAAVLTEHGLSGASMTLPVVYGWMMGYPPGWLERALLSAVREGHLQPPSSSKPMATRSARKSRKQ